MSEVPSPMPEIPTPLPRIPRAKLWATLVVPPVATFIANCLTGVSGNHGDYGVSFLWVPLFSLAMTGVFLYQFNKVLRPCYQGRSAVMLGFFYFIGQIVVCLAVWFGSCFLFIN